jgi:methylenetetrahydrofolate dehydrogenase (NADP+)/methenyltetrahydrofolate cyclohydrolase
MTRILDGGALASGIRADVSARAAELTERGVAPKLAVVTATADESTAWYVRSIAGAARKSGVACDIIDLGPGATDADIFSSLTSLSHDPDVHGIILQTPLPAGTDLSALREAIAPDKDIDGANSVSLGRLVTQQRCFAPATAQAVLTLLDHHDIELRGRNIAVVGRSIVVGTPVANMLVQRDATVTLCHRYTPDLAVSTSSADIIVVAVGIPGLITATHIRQGAVVIDVGTTATEDGRLLGDVDANSVQGRAGGLTPVPGGVGPVTTALLLANTVTAAIDLDVRAGTRLADIAGR